MSKKISMKKMFVLTLLLSVAQSNCMLHRSGSGRERVLAECLPDGEQENRRHCVYDITDEDLIGVVQLFPGLISINLGGCTRFTIDGLQILAKCCKQLSSIALYDLPDGDCEGIDPHGYDMRKFREKYPAIQIITRSPWQLEQEQKQKEYEEKVRKIKEAQEEERRKRDKNIKDILGDDRIFGL